MSDVVPSCQSRSSFERVGANYDFRVAMYAVVQNPYAG